MNRQIVKENQRCVHSFLKTDKYLTLQRIFQRLMERASICCNHVYSADLGKPIAVLVQSFVIGIDKTRTVIFALKKALFIVRYLKFWNDKPLKCFFLSTELTRPILGRYILTFSTRSLFWHISKSLQHNNTRILFHDSDNWVF